MDWEISVGDGHRESSPFVRWKKGKKKETRGGRKRRLVLSRVGTFQLNCKLKRIFYSSVVGTIGSDRKYSKARATFPSRIKFAISFPALLDRENLDNFVNDFPNFEGKSNFLRADFLPPASNRPFRNTPRFQYRECWPSRWWFLFYFLLLFLSIGLEHSAWRQRLHRYFARITISPDSLFAVETEWNAAFYVVIFVQVPRCFRRKLFSASIVRTFRVKIWEIDKKARFDRSINKLCKHVLLIYAESVWEKKWNWSILYTW